jgi:hypothetical protein
MRIGKLGKLVAKNMLRSRRTLFFSSIGVVVGITTCVFFLSLGFGMQELLRERVLPKLPPNEIEVEPEVFATGRRSDSFLTEGELEKIRRIPKVRAVHKRIDCAFPAMAYLEEDQARRYFQQLVPQTILFVDGVRSDLVRNDPEFFGNREKFVFPGDDPAKPIPVVISHRLYNLYVSTAAPQLKLPVFSKQMFIGFRFNIRLGRGVFREQAKQGRVRERFGEIVGFSNYGAALGVTMPAEYLELYNREYAGPEAAHRYKSLIVSTASPEDKVEVSEALRQNGFRPAVDQMAELVIKIATVVSIIFNLISLVIVAIAAIHITHTFFMLVYERKTEIGLMRSVGATRGDIRVLIVGEAFLLGLLSGAVGVGFGLLSTEVADWAAVRLWPNLAALRGPSFFVSPATVLLGALGFAALFCALGAILPARQAAQMEPARALAQ